MDDAPRTPATPGPLASFARFVLLGGGVGVLSSGAVALLAGEMPWALANALITIASTLLCTELHARFTFGSGQRAGWRQHWQSAGSAAAAYVVTCAAMFVLHLVQSSPGMLTEQIVYLSASGLAGLARFLLLRLYVFATGRTRTAAPEQAKSPAEQQNTIGAVSPSVPVPARPRALRPAWAHTAPGGRTSARATGFPVRTRTATTESRSRCLRRHSLTQQLAPLLPHRLERTRAARFLRPQAGGCAARTELLHFPAGPAAPVTAGAL